MTPEAALRKEVKRVSLARRFRITWNHVESPLTSPGISDFIGVRRGHVAFVELKAGAKFHWRADQRAWAARHVEAGANVWLLLKVAGYFYLWRINSLDKCRWTNQQLMQAPDYASGILDDMLGVIFNA